MNGIYLRSKEDVKKITFKIILALFPLLIAGFYKNGIKLYLDQYVSLYQMFKPLLLDIIGFMIGIIVNVIYETIIKKRLKLFSAMFSSFHPLYGLLVASIVTINIRIYYFAIVTFVIFLLSKFLHKFSINIVALTALIIILISKYLGTFSFLNIYEQTNDLHLTALDYLIGRGSGGINTTFGILLILSLIILWSIKAYKKDIVVYCATIYCLFMIGYGVATNNIGLILDNIFSNGVLFCFVFIAPEFTSSSYTVKGKIIYSFLISAITFGLYLKYPSLAVYVGILFASIFHGLIDKLVLKFMK